MKFIKWTCISLAGLTVLVTIAFFAWWTMKDSFVFGNEKFDQVKWMQNAATMQSECKRGDMAHDLQQNLLEKGMPRAEVGVLLGRPSYEDGATVEYDLGKCMHVYYGLHIYFDENKRLVHSRISSL